MEKCKEDVIEKVKKLLNLADKSKNSSDEEARAALLKAQEVMAANDISIEETISEKPIQDIIIEYTEGKIYWAFRKPLANIIAENFRCKCWMCGEDAAFLGHTLDARIARESYEYAYDFICREGTRLYNKRYTMGHNTKGVFNSYANGFLIGLHKALSVQSVALMIITPKDVDKKFEDMSKEFKTQTSKLQETTDYKAWADGFKDGSTAINGRRITK